MQDEIKRLQNELICVNSKIKGCDRDCLHCNRRFEDIEIIRAYEAAIEALEETYWRDPEKELPEKGAKVLALSDDGFHIPAIEIALYEGSSKYSPYWIKDSYEMEDLNDVIGWRPLPEVEK